ncbi:MAG TPA: TonB-dependent receptor, partial [Chitinophagaceae bacterium]
GPEKITSLEVGYKSVLLDNTLTIDVDAYSNTYNGFLGQVQVYVPIGTTVGTDAAVLSMLDRNRDATAATSTTAASQGQSRYRVYTNATGVYHNFGSSVAVNYNFYKKYTVGGVLNYNEMRSGNPNDIFVTGFNTPKFGSNISFGNREVAKNIGFNVVWRWQDSFLWQSPLVNGTVPAFSTLDAQVNFRVPKAKTTIKFGGSNIFDHRYIQYAGGPTLGAIYYVAITLDGLLK